MCRQIKGSLSSKNGQRCLLLHLNVSDCDLTMFIYSDFAALVLVLTFHSQAHAGRIIGGHEAAAHSKPYMALLTCHSANGNTSYCGGFLVSEYFVMTAAHCKAKTYEVCLGVHDFASQNKLCLSVEQDFPHEKYENTNYTNDIMLLKLSTKVVFDKNVQPIVLADVCDNKLPKTCLVSGWGTMNEHNKDMSYILREVNVTLTHDDLCPDKNVYCSKGEKGPGEGDSGGPLVCEDGKAFGLISAKHPCLKLTTYTKIPDYREWIDEIMKHK
uniref:trypsin n=2 Tax=Poecilia formosa TaxID=48698 RepID=A0A087XBZ0_POEFO